MTLTLPVLSENNRLRLIVVAVGLLISVITGLIFPESFGVVILVATCAALQAPDLKPKLLQAGPGITLTFYVLIGLGIILRVAIPSLSMAPAMGYLLATTVLMATDMAGTAQTSAALVRTALKKKKRGNRADKNRYGKKRK